MDPQYRDRIANEFRKCVDDTIRRVANTSRKYRPFHTALLSEDVIFWSSFERSFSTSFGQRVIERIAELVALSNGADAVERQKEAEITIDIAYENAINQHILNLRNGNKDSVLDFNTVLNEILSINMKNQTITMRVISDLWWQKDGVDNYISIKTVKPNIDQTEVAKKDCLHLKVANSNCNTYFGLPYNPFGESKEDYKHNPPTTIFDLKHDPVVLIGKEMWDTIGGSGCYNEILTIAAQVGKNTRTEIKQLRP